MIQQAAFATAGALFLVGLYAVVFKDNMIKKVLGLMFISDAVNLLLIAMGYRAEGIVPIILPGVDPLVFASRAAYPLPMALVLTNIVIAVATMSLILGLCVRIYQEKKTLSARRIWADGK